MTPLGKAALAVATSGLVFGATAATAPAGLPATNAEGRFIDLDVNVFPPRTGAGAIIEFHSFTGNRTATPPPATSANIKLSFPKGFALHPADFPRCKLNPDDFSACTNKSLFASGTAEGALTAADGKVTFVPVTLKGYNGSVVDGRPTLIFIGSANGQTLAELDFKVSRTSNGPVLDDYTPPSTTQGAPTPNSSLAITKFDLRTRKLTRTKNRKRINFIQTPSRCPKKGWKFVQTNTYPSGPLTATSYAPCTG